LEIAGLSDLLDLRLSDIFEAVYEILLQNYRCEYIFKNTLMQNWFLSRHSTDRSFITDEFRVGKSRVDLALFSKTSVAFEIKTEFDSPKRLPSQSNAYMKVFDLIYPTEVEHFTDMNTQAGNPAGVNWGDYSIIGDQYSEGGGAALAVAIHHIHKSESTGALQISHFLSDEQQSTANVSGKVIQAVRNLVNNLDSLLPNDTCACNIYRDMAESGNSRGLGFLKRLAILHHLETMLADE
jgi:hypothetical protein